MARDGFVYDESYFDDLASRTSKKFESDTTVEYANTFTGNGKIIRILPLRAQVGGDYFRKVESYYFSAIGAKGTGIKGTGFYDGDGNCLIARMIHSAKQSTDMTVRKKVAKEAVSAGDEYYFNFIEIDPATKLPIPDSLPKILCARYTCFNQIREVLRADIDYMKSFLEPVDGLNLRVSFNDKKYSVVPVKSSTIDLSYYEDENLNDIDTYLSYIIRHPSYIKNFMDNYLYNEKMDSKFDKLKYKDYLEEQGGGSLSRKENVYTPEDDPDEDALAKLLEESKANR